MIAYHAIDSRQVKQISSGDKSELNNMRKQEPAPAIRTSISNRNGRLIIISRNHFTTKNLKSRDFNTFRPYAVIAIIAFLLYVNVIVYSGFNGKSVLLS